MLKKSLKKISAFVAGDKTILKEFVHPKNDKDADPNYSLAHALVGVGQASEPHILHHSNELYIILSGKGELYIGDEMEILRGGDAALVPKGAIQWIKNIGKKPLQFYIIVSPPWQESEEEIL